MKIKESEGKEEEGGKKKESVGDKKWEMKVVE